MLPVNKSKRRLIDAKLRYKGFDLPEQFVVGYGLDFEKKCNLPLVGVLKAGTIETASSKVME